MPEDLAARRSWQAHTWLLAVVPLPHSVCITEVVLMRLPEWFDVERRYLPGVVSQLRYRTSKVVRTHTHLDADQARRHVGKSCNDFVASNLLAQDDGASGIETN